MASVSVGQGCVVDGKRLINEETLSETWHQQIKIAGGVGYGLGWMVRDWHGQRLIEHGGNVRGFAAQVAILPDSDLGFVLLTNAHAPLLQPMSITLVPDTLFGEWEDDSASEVADFRPYLGKYIANFATFSNEVFTIIERNGHLALDIPSQMVFDLNPPDKDGKWQFSLTDQIALSFERDDDRNVVGLRMYQAGMEFEVIREGVEIEPEIDLDELQKYLGSYQAEQGDLSIEVLIQNQRLAIKVAGGPVFDLHPPDEAGTWASRANKEITVAFEQSETGAVVGMDFSRPGGRPVIKLRAGDREESPLPTVEELIALRQKTAGDGEPITIDSVRTSGVVRYPHAAVEGRFEITTAGDDRLRFETDLGRFGKIWLSLSGDRGWRDTTFELEPFQELSGKLLAQARQGHPSALYGDWRKFFDSVSVLREGEFEGRKIYVVKLAQEDLPAIKLSVDAETGDVLKVDNTVVLPGLGALPITTVNEDFRNVHGMRIPYRYVDSNEQTGRTVYDVEKVEINLDLAEDAFVRQPPRE